MAKLVVPQEFQGLPVVTAEQMRNIDARAASEFGVPASRLMENAGRAVAEAVLGFVRSKGKDPAAARVVVSCGRGNNGGDGLAASRHLQGRVAEVRAFLVAVKEGRAYAPEVADNLAAASAAGVPVETVDRDLAAFTSACAQADALVDALLGTGSTGKPAGTVHKMIQLMNRSKKPVVSVDIPSGLMPDTGYHSGAFITASLTLALGLPKRGLLATHAQRNVGELRVLDIGFPKELLAR